MLWLIYKECEEASLATFGSGRSGRSAPSGSRDWDAARLARERPRCLVPNQSPGDRFFRARPCVSPSCCYGAGQLGRGALWGPSGGKIRKIRTFPLGDFIEFAPRRLRKRSLAGSLTRIVSFIGRLGCQSALPRRRERSPTEEGFRSTRARGGHLGQSSPWRMRPPYGASGTAPRDTLPLLGADRSSALRLEGTARDAVKLRNHHRHCGQRARPTTPLNGMMRRVEN